MKKLAWFLGIAAVAAFLAAAFAGPAAARDDKAALLTGGTISAGNNFYQVHVQDSDTFGVGKYTVSTGPSHPASLANNNILDIFYGGADAAPATSFNTIRSYTTNTDYTQIGTISDTIYLNPFGSASKIGTTGVRTTYNIPGTTSDAPDALTIVQDVNVRGDTYENSSVEVTTAITNNDPENSVKIGVRYLWDFQLGEDDGPTFQAQNPNGAVLLTESEFNAPEFEFYEITDNDVNENAPILNILGTVTGPASLAPVPTPPGLLKYVCWEDAFGTAFDYDITSDRNIATDGNDSCGGAVGGDSAVLYYFGPDEASALTIEPDATVTVSASLFSTPPPPPPPGDTVFFDLKPGGCPNPFNPRQNGVVPAAILGTEGFDVADINTDTIKLCNTSETCIAPVPTMTSIEDAGQPCPDTDAEECACCEYAPDPETGEFDGIPDLALKFNAADVKTLVGSTLGGASVPLTIKFTAAGKEFSATDCLKIVPAGKQ